MVDTIAPKKNKLGLTLADYKGLPSTLCDGCGHDAITSQIIKALFELGVNARMVAKVSGIGCSSKTPTYYCNEAHGINAIHGRVPSFSTGVALANKGLLVIGTSGDGDTASIGLGQFCHLVRRNIPMVYIVENNGVYGLTKGQFSATSEKGAKLRSGAENALQPIDICGLAIELGCGFVARSFAGDPKQLVQIVKAAMSFKGTAVLDVISPCVTFNNHEGSTKSYKYAKEHEDPLHEIDFVSFCQQITVDYEPGTVQEVVMHDGSKIALKKTSHDYDPRDRAQAVATIHKANAEKQFITGLLYIDESNETYQEIADTVDEPLSTLPQEKVRPPKAVLDEIMKSLM
jgi:2-oxoglutarate/2-oxoacid ferredoxin oxidoreductase subunit beta